MGFTPEKASVQIIEAYYLNDRQMFFDYMDENVIWMGPATQQYIEGKQLLLHAFEQENTALLFRTAQMSSKCIPGGTDASCEVLLKFIFYTYYPSGYVAIHNQRIMLFWRKVKIEDKKVWRFAMIHISNGMETAWIWIAGTIFIPFIWINLKFRSPSPRKKILRRSSKTA